MQRRQFMQAMGTAGVASSLGALSGCATPATGNQAKVVVIGGGFAGATAAKYIRLWSDQGIDVTLVEPQSHFVSCPVSNHLLGGSKSLADITLPFDALNTRYGVRVLHDYVSAIDPERRRVTLAGGGVLPYDRLVVSPGVEFMWETLPGMAQAGAQDTVLHAWKAGAQTVALRKQLQAMPDGGVYALTIPLAPYRCPPGPYERACLVADYFRKAKPRSKVLVLDANEDVTSKGPLFKKAWAERYAGIVEYRPRHALLDVDARSRTLHFELQEDIRADVLNVLPPMRAGDIALRSGLANVAKRWCDVDFLSFESRVAPHIHVLGDAAQNAPAMPKSGHMANQHGKTCAAAIVALLSGQAPNPEPVYNNACYSYVSDDLAMHVTSVHRYDADKKTMLTVNGAGGVSPAPSALEGRYAEAWAHNIWADTLA